MGFGNEHALATVTYLFMSTFHLQKEVKQRFVPLDVNSKQQQNSMALICLDILFVWIWEPWSEEVPLSLVRADLWPRQEPIRCCWHRVGFMWASCGRCCPRTSQGTQGQRGFWGIHQVNRVLGGRGLSHISEHGGMRCVCVVYCNVVCLNMIWFLVLLDPFQTNTSLVLFMLFWILKDIPCISQWSHKKTCYFLTLEALWHPPNFLLGWLNTQRYRKIIFLPLIFEPRMTKGARWGVSYRWFFFCHPLTQKVQRPLWHGWNGWRCLDFVILEAEKNHMCAGKDRIYVVEFMDYCKYHNVL